MRPPIVQAPPPVYRINVTPIIDVALVLVIILLVTAPLLSVADLDVTLPGARTRDVDELKKVLVTLGRDGALAIDEDRIEPEQLRSALRQRLAKEADPDAQLVIIRADQTIPHRAVAGLVEDVRAAGARRVAMATSQKVVQEP